MLGVGLRQYYGLQQAFVIEIVMSPGPLPARVPGAIRASPGRRGDLCD